MRPPTRLYHFDGPRSVNQNQHQTNNNCVCLEWLSHLINRTTLLKAPSNRKTRQFLRIQNLLPSALFTLILFFYLFSIFSYQFLLGFKTKKRERKMMGFLPVVSFLENFLLWFHFHRPRERHSSKKIYGGFTPVSLRFTVFSSAFNVTNERTWIVALTERNRP